MKRRYRQLVKQWHPDRFAGDSANEAEATERLAHFNAAYHLLTAEADPPRTPAAASHASTPPSATSAGPGSSAGPSPETPHRLSREQIDAIVNSIGTAGPLDGILSWFDQNIYPTPHLTATPPTPAAILGGILVAALAIGLEVWPGHHAADPVLLVMTVGIVLYSWLAKKRSQD